ncbi:MAG: hypothetical protein V1853_03845 [bacterium]
MADNLPAHQVLLEKTGGFCDLLDSKADSGLSYQTSILELSSGIACLSDNLDTLTKMAIPESALDTVISVLREQQEKISGLSEPCAMLGSLCCSFFTSAIDALTRPTVTDDSKGESEPPGEHHRP